MVKCQPPEALGSISEVLCASCTALQREQRWDQSLQAEISHCFYDQGSWWTSRAGRRWLARTWDVCFFFFASILNLRWLKTKLLQQIVNHRWNAVGLDKLQMFRQAHPPERFCDCSTGMVVVLTLAFNAARELKSKQHTNTPVPYLLHIRSISKHSPAHALHVKRPADLEFISRQSRVLRWWSAQVWIGPARLHCWHCFRLVEIFVHAGRRFKSEHARRNVEMPRAHKLRFMPWQAKMHAGLCTNEETLWLHIDRDTPFSRRYCVCLKQRMPKNLGKMTSKMKR